MRRRSFAAPLVIVIACHPSPPVAPDPDDDELYVAPPPATVYRAARPDEVALPPPVPDAPDAVERTPPPPRPGPPDDVCRDPFEAYRVWHVSCNPPPPCRDQRRPRRDGDAICNPPPAAIGDVIDVKLSGDAVIVTLSVGTDDGVDNGDHATLLDDNGHPLTNGDFVILRVNHRTAMGKVKVTRDRLVNGARVRARVDVD